MIYALFGLLLCFTVGLLVYHLRTDNQALGEAEESERQLKALKYECKKAKSARESLINNPTLRDELRRHHDKG